jgi:hypothetical protein
MPDENTTMTADATQPAPAPVEHVKPETQQPAPASADQPKPEDAQFAPPPAAATQQSPAITRAPTRVARGVTRKGAPNTAAAAARQAKPAKPAAPAKAKVPDYRKLKLDADDVIGGVRKKQSVEGGHQGPRLLREVPHRHDRRRSGQGGRAARLRRLGRGARLYHSQI